MSELTSTRTRTRFDRRARGVAAALAVLGLVTAGVVVEAHVADRGAGTVRTEAPSTPGVAGHEAQARARLADLVAQRSADLACGAMAHPQRAC